MHNKENKFDYGESVRISCKAPSKYHPSEIGFICGMIDIDSKEAAIAYDCLGSDWLYTVELLNGNSLQIPENLLETDPDRLKFTIDYRVFIKEGLSSSYHPSEVLTVIGYHQISEESLAKEFNLKKGDFIYILRSLDGEEVLIPEVFIDRECESM